MLTIIAFMGEFINYYLKLALMFQLFPRPK